MLPSNGRIVKQHYNYHITLRELGQILDYCTDRFDSKVRMHIIQQFSLGQRASEVNATSLYDFKDDFRTLTYRQAKSNKIITEPICEALRHELKAYIHLNKHRMSDGYIYPAYTGKTRYMTTETIGAYWCKLRQGLAKKYNDEKWIEVSPTGKHRVSSHSLRRLHRTVLGKELGKKGYTDFVIAKLCNYQDVNTFMIYRNEFELEEKKADIIMPIIEPIIRNFQGVSKHQERLTEFF